MNTDAPEALRKLKRKYLLTRSGEVCLLAMAGACIVYGSLSMAVFNSILKFILPLASALIIFIFRFRWLNLHRVSESRVIKFVNHQYPQLEQSADLLLKEPSQLTSLQKLQREKVTLAFTSLYPTFKFPHRLGQAAAFFSVSLVLSILLSSFKITQSGPGAALTGTPQTKLEQVAARTPAGIKDIQITIVPPPYTGKKTYASPAANITLPEGSDIIWTITFTDTVTTPHMIFSGGDVLNFKKTAAGFTLQHSFSRSTFYQLGWTTPSNESKTSDYYKIDIIPDESPEITVHQLTQFTELRITDDLSVDLKSTLSDDYGIQDAYIIATVSKGSGESVKFREEKLPFTSPQKITGPSVQASRTIDLIKLGLEPGDELYFYVEAMDIKSPDANRTRTETFFIALQDTATMSLSIEGGLGVDLMPEYFRSQRQIIIDSEKLLRDRKKIGKHVFNSKSNELGYDQKVLRLKYGEFLGEEFESAIGPGAELPVEDQEHEAEEEDPSKKFGHVHDKENEHNLVPDKKQQPGHEHKHGSELDPDKKENAADAYTHEHDDAEEATFFTQSIRSKLKAALTVMWDAELHLRMFDPEKSLPYQYTALRLLKEISNDSRIYVHKTGFDPPPLKEEKRLTGDLTEIKNSRHRTNTNDPEIYPAIKKALLLTEQRIESHSSVLSTEDKEILLHAGNELSTLALEQPGKFLQSLSLIKTLREDQVSSTEVLPILIRLRHTFWKALPQEKISPEQQTNIRHSLDRAFIKNLDVLKND